MYEKETRYKGIEQSLTESCVRVHNNVNTGQ